MNKIIRAQTLRAHKTLTGRDEKTTPAIIGGVAKGVTYLLLRVKHFDQKHDKRVANTPQHNLVSM